MLFLHHSREFRSFNLTYKVSAALMRHLLPLAVGCGRNVTTQGKSRNAILTPDAI
jgi:hypothetical protein